MSLEDVEKQIGKKRIVSSEHIDWRGRKRGVVCSETWAKGLNPNSQSKPHCVLADYTYISTSSNADIVHGDHLFYLRTNCMRALRETVLPL